MVGIILGVVTIGSLGALAFTVSMLIKDSKKKSNNRARR